jgi:hypothetical protein
MRQTQTHTTHTHRHHRYTSRTQRTRVVDARLGRRIQRAVVGQWRQTAHRVVRQLLILCGHSITQRKHSTVHTTPHQCTPYDSTHLWRQARVRRDAAARLPAQIERAARGLWRRPCQQHVHILNNTLLLLFSPVSACRNTRATPMSAASHRWRHPEMVCETTQFTKITHTAIAVCQTLNHN